MPSAFLLSVVAGVSILVGAVGVQATESFSEPISARVESQQPDGTWSTVATPQPWGEPGPIYSSDRHPRLVVANRHPTAESVTADITYYNDGTFAVLHEEWTLQPFERRAQAFTVPEEAFWPSGASAPNEGVLVYVTVDDLLMSVAVLRA